jgi:hypothetical protein
MIERLSRGPASVHGLTEPFALSQQMINIGRRAHFTERNINHENALVFPIQFHLPDKSGGLNGSTQHSGPNPICIENKGQIAR